MLLITRCRRWGRRRSAGCRRWGGCVEGQHPDLPIIIALTDFNRSPIALGFYRTEVLALNSQTPFSGCPHLIASRTYNVRGKLIDRDEMVAEMHFLEQVCKIFLDGLPTVNRSSVRHINRVLREERGDGGGIVLVPWLGMFFIERDKPLA